LNVVLKHTILLNENNPDEQATFTLRLNDRTGNWSNTVETGNITMLN